MAYLKYASIKLYAFALLLVCILGYGGYQMRNVITGPIIVIQTPENAAIVSSSFVEVVGHARNISDIRMDGRSIFIDESGGFQEKLLLSPGYNIITVYAEDKFGRTITKTLELIYN
ncbi:hypothetical protein A3D62_01780 [Candidatus Kaiserbacteria bacterium RIFCSPHIGHO2_02_FULL_49_11]|uniref:IPT/TIG domain-containing protein n=1 Tax=Candidatus Kaiserbacteria bacterium RIFCSPHIGHO2_02_FULL_49_11 TaxID=1798489 RepID=A0A1F6D2R3_9BACT|nr:MAG: hypothetical protein A3D62_01780 [Candidatus Kaiserbacteria bacterium RIFCSPHIGHO2_02_FULL_49_11]